MSIHNRNVYLRKPTPSEIWTCGLPGWIPKTKEEKPGTKEGPTGRLKYVEHVLSVDRVPWLKKIAIEEEHEPVVIGLASETDYSSDNDTASETEGI